MAMKIFPAIDLRDGGVVRLLRGDYGQTTRYALDPVEVARGFEEKGASYLHVVDLDGALDGSLANFEVVRAIAQATGLFVEVGGGVRDLARVERYLEAGCARVILGTAAVTDPAFLNEALARFGAAHVVVGADLRDGQVAVKGWTEDTGLEGVAFCEDLRGRGVETVIVTDIACDGTLGGTNLELYRRLAALGGIEIVASGGITTLADVAALCDIGVGGAIIGKALYEGALDLSEALALANL